MPAINPYDLQLLKNQAAINRLILSQYEGAIISLSPVINTVKFKGGLFKLSDYPLLKKRVDAAVSKLHNQVYGAVVNGIKDCWQLSNRKNNVLVDKRLSGKYIPVRVRQSLYDPNLQALNAFIRRKENGIDLSRRVWNLLDPFKVEIEQTLGMGLSKGQSAKEMAKELTKNLKEPDRLFRRVRSEEGKLTLSSSARNYHPGQGVYRSSYKNALRLSRTETNNAYRDSDHHRWQTLPFVTGIRVCLSNAHPKYDICDHLAGVYPKDFKFKGWHTQCICFATPEMMSDEEYDKIEDQLLSGETITVSTKSLTIQPPAAFGKYLKENAEMLSRLKNEPYWMLDNPQYIGK